MNKEITFAIPFSPYNKENNKSYMYHVSILSIDYYIMLNSRKF